MEEGICGLIMIGGVVLMFPLLNNKVTYNKI